jgi:DNA polymerase (family X)
MIDQNKKLSRILNDIASMYKFIGGNNPFRALAYKKASQAIDGLPEDISVYNQRGTLAEIQGVGKSIEKDIKEFIKSGSIGRFEKLKKKTPYELMELMDIRGFGAESLKKIFSELHLQTKEEVVGALQDGTIKKIKGFGDKKVEGLLRSLKLHKTIEDRMLLWDALQKGDELVAKLKGLNGVKKIELAGSLRRRKETIGDFDLLISANRADRKKIMEYFTSSKMASSVMSKGETKASIILKDYGRQADLRIIEEHEWGSALQYFTGSKEHNIHLRTLARDKGFKISEYGIFEIRNDKWRAGKTEEEIYETLGMQMMPSEIREDSGEIELAAQHKIPKLIELNDIKGDLQMHSTWSDGLQTLDEIVTYVRKHFNYEYIAITDHSKSSRVAGGLDENDFIKQIAVIKEVNNKLGENFLKAGVEVDILADGSLDISDEILSQMDWVTASIHSGFTQDNTDSLIKACHNPYVHCIGHPTGRLIGKREPYPLATDKLIAAAKETGIALEINAQPERMDFNDELAARAKKAGVKLVISTDSHKLTDFSFMQLGVFVARRAWCTPEDILNTRLWKEIERVISKKRTEYA